jgi:uncharacterized protein YjbJ (UPF0337 family)
MPENFDDAKGQVKEKAGKLTDDHSLENEGKVDQASGKAKSAVDSVKDKVEDIISKDR